MAIHQPNMFPRLTTLAKLYTADCWIVLDDVQFARRDYQHRCRLANLDDPARQRWLSLPTHLPQGRSTLIRNAVITDPALARRRSAGMLRQHFGASPHWPVLENAIQSVAAAFETGRTAAVAEASTRVLLDLLGWKGQILHSSGLPARQGRSQRLADLTAATGARAYLCGTGGMHYLDQSLFAAQSIDVIPFWLPSTSMCSFGRKLSALWALSALGAKDVAGRLRNHASSHRPQPSAG